MAHTPEPRASSRPRAAAPRTAEAAASVRGVDITTPERPVYPELGVTKLALAEYYSAVAERMLPYIADRPLTLVRCERGVRRGDALRSECKFLRHEPGWHRWARPPIDRVQIQEQRKLGEYLVVRSPEGLLSLIQGDVLEIHVWNSRVAHLEQPDRVVFDLDPGEGVAWPLVVRAGRRLRDVLGALGLRSWPKLTGGKGLHVVVPFQPKHDWPAIYTLARRVAEAAAAADPESLTVDFSRRARPGKILIDYKRNHRAAVAVAAYSARARPNGAVGVPVSWDELDETAPDAWTVLNVPRLLRERPRSDPWKDFHRCRQRLDR